MASDQSSNFNERLTHWVASQGFWFQMRYSGVGSGSVLGFHLLRVGIRLGILLLVAVIGFSVYLFRLPGTPGFHKKLKDSITEMLGAGEVQVGGFRRVQGKLLMARLAGEGGSQTFFSTFEARNIRCDMGLLSGLTGNWKPGVLFINELDIKLNAGADDEKSAELIQNSLFRDLGRFKLETIEVKDATLRWGYAQEALPLAQEFFKDATFHRTGNPQGTRGKIAGSHLKVQRVADGWRLHFAGGTFSQCWWQRMEIVEMVVDCTRDGLAFEKAEFRKGRGSVNMDGVRVVAGQRPEVKGVVKFRKVAIEDVVPAAARNFIEGIISGEVRAFGSTNTTEGIGFEGKIVLEGGDAIKLRDRVHLLRALTDFDVFNNFRTVSFNEGSMKIKTQGGVMELTAVDLKAGDVMTLTGQMRARPPTPEETEAALKRTRATGAPAASQGLEEPSAARNLADDPDFTLRRMARAARRDKGKTGAKTEEGSSLFDRIDQNFEMNLLKEQAAERESRRLMYEGQFQVTLPPDTFENVQALREMLPVDPQTGRIPLEVPINGDIYSLTFDQAQELYVRGQRYKESE